MVSEGDSQIEIALDRGEVKAGEHQEAICELELELLSGNTADLLALARGLLDTGALRQGSLSKAARGYHLAQGNGERPPIALDILPGHREGQRRAGNGGGAGKCLAHWLYHDEVLSRGTRRQKAKFCARLPACAIRWRCLAASYRVKPARRCASS
ncbi:Uncharacterized conserved protein [Raoultella terrigena]|uniref:Uncharacterized conserved protein n=1 Tax=Raoultella terrigena TaxID=577 RepID=A0A4U9D255_RAOTE|nr:Uncharacterized conserved protein [Raoultella terrigena]